MTAAWWFGGFILVERLSLNAVISFSVKSSLNKGYTDKTLFIELILNVRLAPMQPWFHKKAEP